MPDNLFGLKIHENKYIPESTISKQEKKNDWLGFGRDTTPHGEKGET